MPKVIFANVQRDMWERIYKGREATYDYMPIFSSAVPGDHIKWYCDKHTYYCAIIEEIHVFQTTKDESAAAAFVRYITNKPLPIHGVDEELRKCFLHDEEAVRHIDMCGIVYIKYKPGNWHHSNK